MAPGRLRRDRLRLDRAGQREVVLRGQRGRHRSGRSTPRRARSSGSSTPCRRTSGAEHTDDQLRRRPLVPAGLRRQRRRLLRRRQPGARARAPTSSRGARAGPGPNLYTELARQAEPRRPARWIWYYQVLPHDVYDWDLQLPADPDQGRRSQARARRPASSGIVIGGRRERRQACVWKTPVGKHNGHDHDNELALDGETAQLPKLPLTVLPGILGGVETQMAAADGVVYAPIVNLPVTFKDQETPDAADRQGDGRGRGAEHRRRLGEVEARPSRSRPTARRRSPTTSSSRRPSTAR